MPDRLRTLRGRTRARKLLRPLEVAIIASARFPIAEPFAGGLEAHTHALAKSLRSRGHRVRVFASERSDPALGFEALCRPTHALELSDAAREDVSMPPDPFLGEHHAYLSLMLRLRRERIDVVHNNSLHYLPIAMAEALEAPVVATLHTPPTPWLESALRARVGRDSPHCVAVSHATAQAWQHALGCSVIHNGVDLGIWRPTGRPRSRRVAWSGRIVPEKGAHLAIDAARAAGLPCVLAGPIGDPAYFAREVGPRLGGDVTYAGHLSQARLSELIAESACVAVTPRWEEPFGLVIAEALACGTPVAAWRRGAVEELVDETCGRTAAPDDVDALARAIESAVSEVEPARCREAAEQRLGNERMVDQYLGLYRRLAA